jgi:hypothetical protein
VARKRLARLVALTAAIRLDHGLGRSPRALIGYTA